ncbi:hypothetical protein CVT25_000830 [Psilocybe cyanescens]|uniref:Secreted protein n=1 Tax=Psilocybe cyanescens TaxID=93625 RepID=A0A409XXU0_PSICY|nr:hypothetical protein CVT25_000830 [Psilocybe cyanescens]
MPCFDFLGTSFLGAFSLLVLASPRAAAAAVLGTINWSKCTSRGAGTTALHDSSSVITNDTDADKNNVLQCRGPSRRAWR